MVIDRIETQIVIVLPYKNKKTVVFRIAAVCLESRRLFLQIHRFDFFFFLKIFKSISIPDLFIHFDVNRINVFENMRNFALTCTTR
jgi:hypothetical protein